jgi:hypothetical protein
MLSGHGACIGDEAVLYPSTHNGQTSHRRRCGGRPFRKSSIRLLTRGPHLWPSYSIAPWSVRRGASCNPLIKLSTLNSAVLFASTPGTAARSTWRQGWACCRSSGINPSTPNPEVLIFSMWRHAQSVNGVLMNIGRRSGCSAACCSRFRSRRRVGNRPVRPGRATAARND